METTLPTLKQRLVSNIAKLVDKRPTRLDKETWENVLEIATTTNNDHTNCIRLTTIQSDTELIGKLAALQEQLTQNTNQLLTLSDKPISDENPTNKIITITTQTDTMYELLREKPQLKNNTYITIIPPKTLLN